MLGERLKLQESKLDELRQDKSKEELLQLLQQANKDMVCYSIAKYKRIIHSYFVPDRQLFNSTCRVCKKRICY